MRRIIVYIATSADGYIARPDGDVGWLDRPEPRGGYGMNVFMRNVDTVLWGRKTHEMGRELGQTSFPGKDNYVFSRRPNRRLTPDVELVTDEVAVFARKLRRRRGKNIWLMGGADLISSFLDAGAVDELMIHVIPVLIGEGIPLTAPRHRQLPLTLLACRTYADGVVRLHYRIQKAAESRSRSR